MKKNNPHIYSHAYLGVTPFAVAHAIGKNRLLDSKFVHCEKYVLPNQSRFWADFEIELIRVYDERFSFKDRNRNIIFEMENKKVFLGSNVKDNVLELGRKFSTLMIILQKSNLHINSIDSRKTEKELTSLWMKVSKNSVYESINFNKIFQELDLPLLKLIYSWLKVSLEGPQGKDERVFISCISKVFLGVNAAKLTPLQLLYLSSKIISKNYFISKFSILNNIFQLEETESVPSFLKTDDAMVICDETNPSGLLKINNYYGSLFFENLYLTGVPRSFAPYISDDKYFAISSFEYSLEIPQKNILVSQFDSANGSDFIIAYDSKLEFFSLSRRHMDISEFLINRVEGEIKYLGRGNFFFLEIRKKAIFELKHGGEEQLNLYQNVFSDKPLVRFKHLCDSHLLGNISSLFYDS